MWAKLIEEGGDPVQIVGAARAFANNLEDIKFAPGPHRWLANGRYDDADLFADEAAAGKAWLQAQWQSANVKAVEDRYHITMDKQYPPDGMTDPKSIAFWYKEMARSWITSIAVQQGAKLKNAPAPSPPQDYATCTTSGRQRDPS